MSEYDCVAKGKLKLKSDSEIKKKKCKKNKNKKCDKIQKALKTKSTDEDNDRSREDSSAVYVRKLTPAEVAFKQQQERMKTKRILEKASMTHKERVEKFNEHLDTLTEHFDIPKVSWTK